LLPANLPGTTDRLSYSLDANNRWRSQFSIEVFGFSARVRQLVFFGRSSLGIEHSHLLKTRVKITTYYDHPDSFLTLALVSKPDTVYELRQSLRPYLISLFVEMESPRHDEIRRVSVH
jgi:hypothetical protein